MTQLVDLLNELVSKYKIAEEDVARIQEALSMLENGNEGEFEYEERDEEQA
jgi:site-specific DNA-adenine methylase